MADMQQDPTAASTPPTAAAPGPETETDDGGYSIIIRVDGNKRLSVGCEDERGEAGESAEGPEGAEGGPQDPGENEDAEMSKMQPASNIKEALTMALAIYKADGAGDATAAHASQLQSQGFAAGYEQD